MKNGMVIIDADGHAVDNEAVYRERLPEQYRKRNFVVSSDRFDRSHRLQHAVRPHREAGTAEHAGEVDDVFGDHGFALTPPSPRPSPASGRGRGSFTAKRAHAAHRAV